MERTVMSTVNRVLDENLTQMKWPWVEVSAL